MTRVILLLSIIGSIVFASNDALFTKKELEYIQKNPTISIGMLNEFKPYSYIENGEHKGFDVELLNEISKVSGLKFDIQTNYWPIVYKKFQHAQLDMIADISYKKSREAFTLYTTPYYEIPNYIFTLKDNNNYVDNLSLIGKNVAVTTNKFYNEELEYLGANLKKVDSTLQKIDLLLKGEVDYYLTNFEPNDILLLQELKSTLKVIDTLYFIDKEDLRFGIHKSKPVLHSIIEKSLSAVDEKVITNLQTKWLLARPTKVNNLDLTIDEVIYIENNPVITYSEINWKPLSIIEDNQMKGIMGDYLQIVAEKTGLTFKFVPADSWPHVLQQFEEGKIDLVPGIGSSPQELQLGLISKQYAAYPMVIVTNERFTFLDGIGDIKDKTFAIPKYYTSYNFVKQNYPEVNIIETSDIPEALLLVQEGRADAFVGHIATSLYYLAQLGLNDLKVSGTTSFEFKHHYLIQRDNKNLVSIINKAFDSITEEQRSHIYAKWVNVQFDEKIDKKVIIGFLLVILFIILLFLIRQREYHRYNKKLKEEVNLKTKELQEFNKSLEQTVDARTKELKDSYEQLEHILNSAMEAILISKEGKAIDCNAQFLKLFGFEFKEEVQQRDILEFIEENDQKNELKNFREEFSEEHEIRLMKKDGTVFFALIKNSTLHQEGQNLQITSFLDLTLIKKKEKILLQQSKMAALGEMIGNIAHQWRQPLSLISTTASGMRLKKEFGESTSEFEFKSLDSIISTTSYLSKTIDDFRNFIIGDKKEKNFYIKEVLFTLTNLIKPSINSNHIHLIEDIDDGSVKIKGYENELLQALINIINNAKDALLTKADKDRYIFMQTKQTKSQLDIIIYDSAGGISEDIINKVFEPYFTTKHNSSGTGIGLYMTYKMLKGMGAKISVENIEYEYEDQVYVGAKFVISFEIITLE